MVGTHALIYGEVPFRSLSVAVIDEQHRFGVEQRALLRAKGPGEAGTAASRDPDVLVMTATPIPRTAAMLIYGDLDKSELREHAPRPHADHHRGAWAPSPLDAGGGLRAPARAEVAAGRQAYVVCPLVEGSERVEAKAATEEYHRSRRGRCRGSGWAAPRARCRRPTRTR